MLRLMGERLHDSVVTYVLGRIPYLNLHTCCLRVVAFSECRQLTRVIFVTPEDGGLRAGHGV